MVSSSIVEGRRWSAGFRFVCILDWKGGLGTESPTCFSQPAPYGALLQAAQHTRVLLNNRDDDASNSSLQATAYEYFAVGRCGSRLLPQWGPAPGWSGAVARSIASVSLQAGQPLGNCQAWQSYRHDAQPCALQHLCHGSMVRSGLLEEKIFLHPT